MEEKKERKSWRDIVSSRNPDLDLEDDLAVGEFLDDSFKRYDDSESQRENLNKVLAEDSRAAGILTGLASGMDENGEPFSLVEYLITNYGDQGSCNNGRGHQKSKRERSCPDKGGGR